MVRARLPVLDERPRTRGDCVDGPRPCPWVTCRHHLLLDIGRDGRLLKARAFDEANEYELLEAMLDMPETCALDVAERNGASAAEVANLLGLKHDAVDEVVRRFAEQHDREDFDEPEHPEDFYIRYSNAGAEELAAITAELRARQKGTKR